MGGLLLAFLSNSIADRRAGGNRYIARQPD
jgi:hypothetical protein